MKTIIAITALLALGACEYSSETWAELDARCPDNQVIGGASTGWGGGTVGCRGDEGYASRPVTANDFGSATGAVAR